ncbi:MAG: hypothetical protein ACOC38_11420 [Promethearchaeia archaeon]
MISSPFLPRFQGDSLAKGHTNVDGVVGHLEFRFGTKARLMVRGDATQLMIIREKVKRRISAYSEDETKHDELKTWYEHSFLRALHDADIRCISWESVIDNTNETSIRDF